MRKLFLILAMLLFSLPALAGTISISWTASASTTVTGYKVYVGTSSRTYTAPPIVIGNVLNYRITNLANGTYYIAVTAYDASGNESDFSNELVTVLVTLPPPTNLKRETTGPVVQIEISMPPDHVLAESRSK